MTAHALIHEFLVTTCVLGGLTALYLTGYVVLMLVHPEKY
jgi:hypothetical protein